MTKVILGLSTYRPLRKDLKTAIAEKEFVVWQFVRDMRTIPEYVSWYWRAFGRFLESGIDADLLGVDAADVLYMASSLEPDDIVAFHKLKRNHDSSPLSDHETGRILRELRAQTKSMISKLRFHHKHDDAIGQDDLQAHFTSEALILIRQYDHLPPAHLLATVRSGLWNLLYNMQRYYGSEKHRLLSSDDNGGFSLGRVSLDETFSDGNPVLSIADENQNVESDISVASFIAAIEKGSERLGAFLRDVTHTKESDLESDCDNAAAIVKEARSRHGVTQSDMDVLRGFARRPEYALL